MTSLFVNGCLVAPSLLETFRPTAIPGLACPRVPALHPLTGAPAHLAPLGPHPMNPIAYLFALLAGVIGGSLDASMAQAAASGEAIAIRSLRSRGGRGGRSAPEGVAIWRVGADSRCGAPFS